MAAMQTKATTYLPVPGGPGRRRGRRDQGDGAAGHQAADLGLTRTNSTSPRCSPGSADFRPLLDKIGRESKVPCGSTRPRRRWSSGRRQCRREGPPLGWNFARASRKAMAPRRSRRRRNRRRSAPPASRGGRGSGAVDDMPDRLGGAQRQRRVVGDDGGEVDRPVFSSASTEWTAARRPISSASAAVSAAGGEEHLLGALGSDGG